MDYAFSLCNDIFHYQDEDVYIKLHDYSTCCEILISRHCDISEFFQRYNKFNKIIIKSTGRHNRKVSLTLNGDITTYQLELIHVDLSINLNHYNIESYGVISEHSTGTDNIRVSPFGFIDINTSQDVTFVPFIIHDNECYDSICIRAKDIQLNSNLNVNTVSLASNNAIDVTGWNIKELHLLAQNIRIKSDSIEFLYIMKHHNSNVHLDIVKLDTLNIYDIHKFEFVNGYQTVTTLSTTDESFFTYIPIDKMVSLKSIEIGRLQSVYYYQNIETLVVSRYGMLSNDEMDILLYILSSNKNLIEFGTSTIMPKEKKYIKPLLDWMKTASSFYCIFNPIDKAFDYSLYPTTTISITSLDKESKEKQELHNTRVLKKNRSLVSYSIDQDEDSL